MAGFLIRDTANDPGTPGRTGDDRFGYDQTAGTAWVFDGATDVTALKPFRGAESGAAWVADALSRRLMQAPHVTETARAYWRRVLSDVRARAALDSDTPLDLLPPEAWPIAAGVWMRQVAASDWEFAWFGDCLAIVAEPGLPVRLIGTPEKAEAESDSARALMAMPHEARWERLRQDRAASNSAGHPVFGIDPDAADALPTVRETLAPGTDVVLVSDGLWRLVDPYKVFDADGFVRRVREVGVSGAVADLRRFEDRATAPRQDRVKTRDDACGLWLRTA